MSATDEIFKSSSDGKNYFEITTDSNRRPDYPEDNTLIVVANDMQHALSLLKANSGKHCLYGKVISCKQIYYVKEWSK